MVLLLQTLCLIRLRDCVESGTPPHVHLLPPPLRQWLLNKVLMHGTINDPKCSAILGSVDFLRNLQCLNMQIGYENDNRYLDRVAESLDTILPNGETMGAKIEKLSFNLYVYRPGPLYDAHAANFDSVVRVIARCPNLVSLNLRVVDLWLDSATGRELEDEASRLWFIDSTNGGFLNESDTLRPCLLVLENLSVLSLTGGFGTCLLVEGLPIIRFKRLTTLRLQEWNVDAGAWSRLLQRVQGTLTKLCATELQFWSDGEENAHPLLPFPLAHLKTFRVKASSEVECSRQFVRNLSGCEKLVSARLELGQRETADEELTTLASIGALDIDLTLSYDAEDFEPDRFFKLVDSLRSKVKRFELLYYFEPECTPAFKRVFDACSNLTALKVRFRLADTEDEIREAMQCLRSLFSNQERASKLRAIHLTGNVDGDILESIFKNCLRLDSLEIEACPQLNDDILIEWAEYGARPRSLTIDECYNISDAGLVLVMLSFGERFSSLRIHYEHDNDKVTSRAWRIAIDHCPNVSLAVLPRNRGVVSR